MGEELRAAATDVAKVVTRIYGAMGYGRNAVALCYRLDNIASELFQIASNLEALLEEAAEEEPP